ncbi:cysteinyl leukotriene receptor 1 isoform X3 [Bufo gargarizans]|uniref:cysteinyl leukotriene receptor 1 isoform X3 n=1 Tax=Bufo gargarizans TaxID=30331 RepID=UPI001CF0D7C2|nr:cysteinyl leukotriene receptor 1 isoform X3 [Bufo gargarizans]
MLSSHSLYAIPGRHLLTIPDMSNITIPYYNASNCSIDDFRNKVYSTAYSMYAVFGLIGNSFALFVLLRTYSQRTAFHIYMLNLAISDLLFICTLPLRVVYYVSRGQWYFGENFRRRLSTFRKHSVTSMAHEGKKNRKKSGSLHDKSEVFPALEKQDSDES